MMYRPLDELSPSERAELVDDAADARTEHCECCGIWVPVPVRENEYGRSECDRCRDEGRGSWPYVEHFDTLFGASLWAYENGRVKVVAHGGVTATHVARRCGERRWPL